MQFRAAKSGDAMKHVSDRRTLLKGSAAALAASLAPWPALAEPPQRLVLVHGRAQGGRDVEEIRGEWLAALAEGAAKSGHALPGDIEIVLPFYGDRLDELVEAAQVKTASGITAKGNATQDDYLRFQADLANDLRMELGITDEQVNDAYGDNPKEKGPLNWEWVQAIVKAIDSASGTITAGALEIFTRDVFLYLELNAVRQEVDRIVAEALTSQPTVVVGHSLGSVVAYNILRTRAADLNVPLYLTVGSPLGIRAIRTRLAPIAFPASVTTWLNYYDERDIVSLNPLDDDHFRVDPKVSNVSDVQNQTDNRHGISGYLNDQRVAANIVDSFL